jgi:protein-disulfide isomerase
VPPPRTPRPNHAGESRRVASTSSKPTDSSTLPLLVQSFLSGKPFVALASSTIHRIRVRQIMATQWSAITLAGSSLAKQSNTPTIVEFSDYQCPFCRRANAALDSVLPRGSVNISYHHLPITALHPAAYDAAKASICADAQGHFLAMHRFLMTTSAWERNRDWMEAASRAGVPDTVRFRACLNDASTIKRLEQDRQWAEMLGVSGTPAFFISTGPLPSADLNKTIAQLDSERRQRDRR